MTRHIYGQPLLRQECEFILLLCFCLLSFPWGSQTYIDEHMPQNSTLLHWKIYMYVIRLQRQVLKMNNPNSAEGLTLGKKEVSTPRRDFTMYFNCTCNTLYVNMSMYEFAILYSFCKSKLFQNNYYFHKLIF